MERTGGGSVSELRLCIQSRSFRHFRSFRLRVLPTILPPRKFPNLFRLRPLPGPRGVSYRMPEVVIHDDESFERALRRFKKKCEKAGILSDLRKHRHFEKSSEKRKRKMSAAVRKTRRGPRVLRA